MRIIKCVAAFVLIALLAGCETGWREGSPSAPAGGMAVSPSGQVVSGEDARVVALAAAQNGAGPVAPYGASGQDAAYEYAQGYRVGAGDRMTIRVLGQPDLSGDYLVNASGQISMPLVHTIDVAGLSAPQIEDAIAARLRNGYLRSPSVSVQVTTMRPFYILGEVNQSGSFAYRSGMTAQNAIALGGGYTARANQHDVLITRKTAEGTDTYKVPVTTQLYPGDIVYVRERWF